MPDAQMPFYWGDDLAEGSLSAGWKGTCSVRANHELSRASVSFDETDLVPNAGLLPAAVLAQRLDLAALVDRRLHLTRHGEGCGAKVLTVIGSMLAGVDSIDDVAVLRAGATGLLFDGMRAPSTVGSWLRAHTWSDVRQLARSAASSSRGCGRSAPARWI